MFNLDLVDLATLSNNTQRLLEDVRQDHTASSNRIPFDRPVDFNPRVAYVTSAGFFGYVSSRRFPPGVFVEDYVTFVLDKSTSPEAFPQTVPEILIG